MKIVTNGTFISMGNEQLKQPPVLRRFQVLAEHGQWLWIIALNGNNTGEGPLTFPKSALTEVK